MAQQAVQALVLSHRKLEVVLKKATSTPTDEVLAEREKAKAALDRAIFRSDTVHRRFVEVLRARTAAISDDPGWRDAIVTSVLHVDGSIEGGIEAGGALELGSSTQNQMRSFCPVMSCPNRT